MIGPHVDGPGWWRWLSALAMWQTMVVVMMTPTVWPWMRAFARLSAGTGGGMGTTASVAAFGSGYFAIWLAYSAGAAALQVGLPGAAWLHHEQLDRPVAGLVLIAAGVFQFLPLKRACLSHCRNPFTYFLARWKDGPSGGFRLGLTHGAYCLGCCWLMMLTGFSMGLMNLAWMALLTVVVCLEQVAPGGERIGRAAGVGFALWGLTLLIPA